MLKLFAATVFLGLLSGCASTVSISTPLLTREYPEGLDGERKVLLVGFQSQTGKCFREEIEVYLRESKGFAVLTSPEPLEDRQLEKFIEGHKVNFVLSGDVDRHEAGSNAKDRNFTVGYFTAFIITAPIAYGYAAATDWKGYALASAKMSVVDTRTDDTIWSLKDSISINEQGNELVADDKIKEALLPIACKNLVTKMLNNFMRSYATTRTKK